MAAANQVTIPDHVKPILARVEVDAKDATLVRITEELDPKVYLACSKVLQALGGKWERKTQATRFHTDAAPLITEALESGKADKRHTILQAFFTKPDLARRMLAKLDLKPTDRFLEPSAGNGGLIQPILDGEYPSPAIGAVIDIDDHHHDTLCNLLDPGTGESAVAIPMIALIGDFLTMEMSYRPTAIAMNPPFSKGQDIAHIKHAYRILADGGRMVAIASESAFLPRQEQFREWLSARNAECERVPADSFEGTTAAARMIYIEKPQTKGT